jgi:hypothetical protein
MGVTSEGKLKTDFKSTDKGNFERTPASPLTAELPVDPNGRSIQVLRPVAGSTKTVASGGGTLQSSAVGTTGIYEVTATADAYIEVSSDPTATTSTMFLAGGIPKFMRLLSTDKIAALQKASAGVIHITRWE